MPVQIPYQRYEKDLHEPTLEVTEDSVSLALPPMPRWIELSTLAFYCASSFAWLLGFGFNLIVTVRIHAAIPSYPSGGVVALIACLGLFGIANLAVSAMLLIVRIRQQPVPRRIQISRSVVWFSHRGMWRIKSRSYPLSEITRIRLRTIKGLLGKPAGAVLNIGIGRWRTLRMRFGRKWMTWPPTRSGSFGVQSGHSRVNKSIRRNPLGPGDTRPTNHWAALSC